MNTLNFSTGVKTFAVNDGAVEISYNPTDPIFVERVYDVFLSTAEKYEAGKDQTFEDNKAFFEYARQRDREVHEGIDGLFGDGVSDGVFGGVSSYAMADGLPLWCNFLLAIIDTVPTELSAQIKASKPRVEKYLKKYHR